MCVCVCVFVCVCIAQNKLKFLIMLKLHHFLTYKPTTYIFIFDYACAYTLSYLCSTLIYIEFYKKCIVRLLTELIIRSLVQPTNVVKY